MRNWKIGSLTAGVVLIAIGLLWFFQSFISIPYTKILLNTWPIACILLGIEILAFHLVRKEDTLRFHWFSIILIIMVMFASIAFNFGHLFFKQLGISLHSSRVEIKDDQLIPTSIEEVVIDTQDAEVNVVGNDSRSLKVNGSIFVPENKKDSGTNVSDYYVVKTIGNTMYIECKQENFHFIDINESRANLTIELPKNIQTKLKASDGSIHIQNKTNRTELELDDGEMKIDDISGIIIAKANDGQITLNNANLNNGSKIRTNDGNIEIENVKGFLNAKVDNGSISVNQAHLIKNSKVMTDDGEIVVENLIGYLNVSSSQGMTTIRHANLEGNSEIITEDGEIQIEDVIGEITTQSKNGSITVNHATLNGESSIRTDDGDIRLDILEKQDLTITANVEDGSIDGNIGWKKGKNKEKQKAILGEGTNHVSLKTINGSIIVNK